MAESDEHGVPGDGDNRHQNRHQSAPKAGGKRGPGRPRRPPPLCRYVGWTSRHGHRYQACPRVDGKRVYGAAGTWEHARDEAHLMAQRARATAGKVLISLQVACQQIIDLAPSNGTQRDYDECCTTLCAFFGAETPLTEVSRARIEDYIVHRRAARWRGKPIGDLRIRKELRVLGRVFNVAIRKDQYPEASPLLRIEMPKAKPREAEHFTIEELAEVVAAVRSQPWPTAERSWRIVAALAFSGLRRAEFCKLRVEQVDFEAGKLRRVDGKRNVVDLPMTKPLAAALRPLVAGLRPTDAIVPAGEARGPRSADNRPRTDLERREGAINGLFRRFRAVLPERLRSRFHPHTLRHTFRTILADAGVASHIRDTLTRHASRGEGARYDHASALRVRNDAQRVLDPLAWIVVPTHGAEAANA